MTDAQYEVYAVQYGWNDRRSSENFIGGDPHDEPMPLNYYVWAIVGGGRTFVVDTGFDQRGADLRGRTLIRPVAEAVAALGIDPGGVEDVIITHLHYDHCGNGEVFPRARFHLQDSEMAYATGRCMCHGALNHAFEIEDVVAMVRRVYQGRVVFHDGVEEIAPGITLHHVGGHTRGLQVVRVRTRRGYVVLASDATHHYAHIGQRRVFPVVDSVGDLLEGYRTVERLADSPDHIVPGHDPLVCDLYPAARPGTEGWAVRLDADPKPR